jgi:hypothetical protein
MPSDQLIPYICKDISRTALIPHKIVSHLDGEYGIVQKSVALQ